MSTLRELEMERTAPRLLEVLRRQGLASLTQFQQDALEAGIMRGRSQILVTYDFDEAYQIIEIALLNVVASDVRAKVVLLCPNQYQLEKRLHSIGVKCGRLGIEITILKRQNPITANTKIGRVLIGTFTSMDAALRTNPTLFEDLHSVFIDRLDLIGQPGIGSRLESFLVLASQLKHEFQTLSILPAVADLEELRTWLNATIIEDTKADVRRIYSVKVFSKMYDSLKDLTEFVHFKKGQIIILCSDIENCENIASKLSGIEKGNQPILDLKLPPLHKDELREISSDVLKHYSKTHQTSKLALNVSRGIAFIHEGVPKEQRRIISAGWEEGVIPVITMPIRFAVASGLRATVVFLIGVFTQDLGEDISNGKELQMLSEWQFSDVLNSAGRRGRDNQAYGIVVVNRDIEKSRIIAKYFKRNPDRSISPILGEVDSTMDDLENLQDLALVSLCRTPKQPESLFSVIDKTYWAVGHRTSRLSDSELSLTDETSVDDLISLRSTKATVSRAEEIPDSSVKLVSVAPTKIAGLIRSSSREIWHYVVLKSEEGVSCSCESWKYQGIRKHRLCKHLVKFSNYAMDNVQSKPYALSVLKTALWGLEIIGEMEKDNLLHSEGKTVNCTKLGRKVASLGVHVKDVRAILDGVSRKGKDARTALSLIVEDVTGLPNEYLKTILETISKKDIEDIAISTKIPAGILENYLESCLYYLNTIISLEGEIQDKKLIKEFKKMQEKLQGLLVPVS